MASRLELIEGKKIVEKSMHVAQNPAKVIVIYANPEKAFLDLYQGYYEKVKQYALQFCKIKEDAEDAAQVIFMKLWEKRDRLHLISTVESYLFTMTRNQYINEKRSHDRKKAFFGQLKYTGVSQANLTDQYIYFKETKRVLDKSIHQLPPRMKLALMLKRDGYNRKEISLSMRIHSNTVKHQLHTAIKRIEPCMQVI